MHLHPSPFEYFRISGADRLEWLQGQITQDLRLIQPNEWKRTAVLTATGQMTSDGGVWMFDDELILGLDRHAAAETAATLQSRIIIEDVDFTPMPPANTIFGPTASPSLSVPTEHAGRAGHDIFQPLDMPSITAVDYNILRVEAAIPIAGIDYGEKTLAMELGDHFIRTRIAFDKGCYTGQEVVERIRSRGRTNKQWVGLSAEGPVEPGKDARITSYALSPTFGHIALAFVPTSLAEPGTKVGNAAVRTLPFV